MPDIAMCPGEGCPKRDTCYRFTADPNPFRQSWFFATPHKDGNCMEYIRDNRTKKDTNDKTKSI